MNSVSYTEEAAFPSLILLIKGELILHSDQLSLYLATPSDQDITKYEICIQFSNHRTEAVFLLFHNAAVFELSHYGVEMMVPSPDPEAPIDIIHDE